jgi:hypothetical protein
METLKDKYTFLGITLALVASIIGNIRQENRLHRVEQFKQGQIEYYTKQTEINTFKAELLERCIVPESEKAQARLVAKYCEAKLDAANSIPVDNE